MGSSAECARCNNNDCICRSCKGDWRTAGCDPDHCGWNVLTCKCSAFEPKPVEEVPPKLVSVKEFMFDVKNL